MSVKPTSLKDVNNMIQSLTHYMYYGLRRQAIE